MRSLKTAYLVIITTSDCNLKCLYCYAEAGNKKEYIREEMVENFILAFVKKFPKLDELVITFFGGEPTLHDELIYNIFKLSNSLKVKVNFRICTNGVCDNSRLWEFLCENKFKIAISMDGIPEVNNLLRGNSSGLEEKIKYLIKKDVKFHIRSTLTNMNGENFSEAVNWWSELGVKLIHFEMVNVYGRAIKNKVKPPDNKVLLRELNRTIKVAEKQKVYLMHSSWMNLSYPSNFFCGSCKGLQYILLLDGNISCCFMADETDNVVNKFIIGKLNEKGKIRWNSNRKDMSVITVNKMSPCKSCSIKKVCGGGCLAKHLISTGSLFTPAKDYCEFKKILIELAYRFKGHNSIKGFEYYIGR